MCEIATKISKPKTTIWKNNSWSTRLSFKLNQFVTCVSQLPKNMLQFMPDQPISFVSILKTFTFFSEQELNLQFPKIETNQNVIQLLINDRYPIETSIKIIEHFLMESKTKYWFVLPLQIWQKQFIKCKREKAPETNFYYVCYFVIEESYSNFSEGIRKMGDQFKMRFLINEVKCKFTLGVPLEDYQLQAFQSFLWQVFTCTPKSKKQSLGKLNRGKPKIKGSVSKSAEFNFDKLDFNAAVFSYFFLTLTQRRPH